MTISTIVADLAAITARLSEEETTAISPVADALSEARQHILIASAAIEKAQEVG